ncbi:HAD family phosphatase [Candidatus Nomurabacteria bacterium]|nr:HAD family phosphatase [Candidatus Nomurabacteria bacterium]
MQFKQKHKFDGILICSDFDGTLAHHQTITRTNIDAIRYFQSEGGLFTVASGRHPAFIHEYSQMVLPNTFICGFNGTLIQDHITHARIHSTPMSEDIYSFAADLVSQITEIDYVDFQFDGSEITLERKDIKPGYQVEFQRLPLFKVLFIVDELHSDIAFNKVSKVVRNRYSISRSWINGIEIQNPGEDKGNALRILRKRLAGQVHTMIGVGDYENDIPMLIEADISFAVENAIPAVKAAADHITAGSETNSIASIIDRLERELF